MWYVSSTTHYETPLYNLEIDHLGRLWYVDQLGYICVSAVVLFWQLDGILANCLSMLLVVV